MSIRVEALKDSISEAKRFIAIAESALALGRQHSYVKGDPYLDGGQYCATVKRASMDVTRAMAKVRRGG